MEVATRNLRLAASTTKLTRSDSKGKTIRPVRRQYVRRVIHSRTTTSWSTSVKRQVDKTRNPSLTNIAQWYLDSRHPSEGPGGLVYAVPVIPPRQTPDSVAEAIKATLDVLKSGPKIELESSDAIWETSDDLLALWDTPLDSPSPPTHHQELQTSTGPLLDFSSFTEPNQSSSQQDVPVYCSSPIDVPNPKDVPVVESSSAPVDDLLISTSPGPATLLAPLLPASTNWEFDPCPDHLSLAPDRRYPLFRKGQQQTAVPLRRKAGSRELKSHLVTPPSKANSLRRTPTCLRVGSKVVGTTMARKRVGQDSLRIPPISRTKMENLPQLLQSTVTRTTLTPGPVTARKRAVQDSLKLRIPSGVKMEDLPPSLQPADTRPGLGTVPDVERDSRITASDVVEDNLKPQLCPLDQDLGEFAFDFPSVVSRGSSRAHRDKTRPRSTTQSTSTSRSSSAARESSLSASTNRPLPPLPLATDHTPPAPHRTSANLGVSNATLKALLSAEDASNNLIKTVEGSIGKSRLSKRSSAIVRDFSEFTHKAFFHPDEEPRSQSDGTLWPSAPSQYRGADMSGEKARSSSVGALAIRKRKGMGIVFAD